jgi:biotin-(acetyl-CoA carboxylase) ligase
MVSIQELQQHPWILIGWGINNESRWKNLKKIKRKWMDLIEWDMEESETEIMEPHFYHDENGMIKFHYLSSCPFSSSGVQSLAACFRQIKVNTKFWV